MLKDNAIAERNNGGPGQVLRVSFPLIVAASGHALRLFADRVMLARYSSSAIAASMPAGLLCFTLMAFFIGTVGYANAFVAQYTGAGQARRTGGSVWQAIYLSLAGGVLVALSGRWAPMLFAWVGHPPDVQVEQVAYFRALAVFGFAGIGLSAVNAFWTGRGRTRTVMAIELLCAGLNVALNSALIFGRFGAPRMGIAGAGLATGLSNLFGFGLALALFLRPAHRRRFGTWPHRTLDMTLMWRMVRFGTPNGLHFMLDLLAFNMFVVFIGRTSAAALEAANIAFGLNALAFMPIVGLGTTAGILVGQGVGSADISYAERSVRSALRLGVLYSLMIGVAFIFFSGPVLSLFARAGDPGQKEILALAAVCLRFVTAYLALDAACIIYSHAVKGAGDTHFTLWMGLALSWGTLVLPCRLALHFGATNRTLWSILVTHIGIAALVYYWRYRVGPWRTMRVIEAAPEITAPAAAEAAEIDMQVDRGL